MTDDRTKVDPVELEKVTTYLDGQSDDRFAEALAQNVMEPDEIETAAFRSPALINRSVVAARYLIDHANSTMAHREGPDATNKHLARATAAFRDKVGRERRVLEQILAGLKAQRGILDNAPNANARALRRLKQRHLAEYQELKAEELEKIVVEKREKRRQAREDAKARKAAEQSGVIQAAARFPA